MNAPAPWDHFAIRRLIFHWPERRVSFVFPLLFLVSVAAHAGAFYLFQVVYPPSVTITPPPAQVVLLTETRENEALLRWADMRDPAAAARIQEIAPAGMGEIAYVPSYTREHAMPKPEVHRSDASGYPSGRDPLASPSSQPAPAFPATAAVRSSLRLSEALRVRDAAPDAPLAVDAKSAASLHPTEFLVAVDDRGEVRFCFLQAGSGDREIDREAESLLRHRAFRRTDTPTPPAWGFATFTWGAEACVNGEKSGKN